MNKICSIVVRFTPFVLLFCLVFLVNSCQTLDRTFVTTPTWQYTVDHFPGSIQSGPIPGQMVHVDPNTTSHVIVTWIGLPHSVTNLLSPIQSRVQRIIAIPEPKLIRPTTQFAQNARFGRIEDANAFAKLLTSNKLEPTMVLGSFSGMLPMGTCAQFTIMPDPLSSSCTQLQFSRPRPEELQIALVTTAKAPAEPNQIRQSDAITETIILEPVSTSETAHFAMLFPCTFEETTITTLAALIEVRGPGHYVKDQDLLNLCQVHLTKAGLSPQRPTQSSSWEAVQETFRNLYEPVSWRTNLLFLATTSHAPLTQEITLAGNWTMAHQLAMDLAVAIQDKEPNNLSELGWVSEYCAYTLLLNQADQELAPTIEAWLILHAGQLGRDPATLRELIGLHNSVAGLHQALIKENRLYLLDMSPAARSRAFEWLKTQGETLSGYDPLASARLRRKALEAIQDYYN